MCTNKQTILEALKSYNEGTLDFDKATKADLWYWQLELEDLLKKQENYHNQLMLSLALRIRLEMKKKSVKSVKTSCDAYDKARDIQGLKDLRTEDTGMF